MKRTPAMRTVAALALSLFLVAAGCGKPEEATPGPPEQAAARVFERAQALEKDHKTREAIAAYHQILNHFPGSPEAKKAHDRIQLAQKAALRRARTRRPG